MITPDEFYSQSQRKMQKENGSKELADTNVYAVVSDELLEPQVEFISSRDYFFLSTVNLEGEPTVSYKGGPVGVVRMITPKQLIFPNYDGNGMFFSLGNISETAKVGMLFIDMETPFRIRVQGRASVSKNQEYLDLFPGANMIVEVNIDSVFVNCARYIHKHKRLESSPYIPNNKGEQPYPAWKRIDLVQDSLCPEDRAQVEREGGLLTVAEYEELQKKGIS